MPRARSLVEQLLLQLTGDAQSYAGPCSRGRASRSTARILAGFLSRGFKDYPIEPVAQPVDTEIDHVAHDDLWPDLPLPGVRVAASFIPSDHAEKRRTKIRLQMWLRGLLVDLAPKDTAPVPSDEHAFLEAVYPTAFDRAGVRRPALPPELRDGPDGPADVLAELVVRGPFGSFLRRPTADGGRGRRGRRGRVRRGPVALPRPPGQARAAPARRQGRLHGLRSRG